MKIPIDIKSGEIVISKEAPKNAIIGIDLGTTNSLIAYIDNESNPVAIKDDSGMTIIPSIIHFDASGEIHVGNDAKPYLIAAPESTIYSVKRLLGKSYKDIHAHHQLSYKVIDNDDDYALVKVQVGSQFYSPVELSAMILKSLKAMAEKFLQSDVSQCVITVPAFFNDAQRQATRDAGKLAGLDVLRIINEPTAASLAYGLGLDKDEEKTIAVYDLGGGTFDLSILKIENGIFEVLATHGDTFLGGDDIDQAIVQHWVQSHSLDLSDVGIKTRLRLHAEEAKKMLSSLDSFSISFEGLQLSLNVEQLKELTLPLINKTLACCGKAIADASMNKEEIEAVVMVGGSTRSPLVKASVSDFFGKQVHDHIDPDHVVALGAAIQADILAGNRKDLLLLDVTPLSLGIETLGGLMDTIIPRNAKIPAKAGRQYTTSVDGQKNLAISVYQGERDLVSYNRKLGSFTLKNIPPMPAGIPKIDIVFILDADGILTVKAKELRSETETEVEIKSAYGISEEEMALMLLASISNATEDMKVKALIEAINEGNAIVLASHRFLQNNAEILSPEEFSGMQSRVDKVAAAVSEKNKDRILEAIDILNQYADPLAHKSMDHTISQALKGEKI